MIMSKLFLVSVTKKLDHFKQLKRAKLENRLDARLKHFCHYRLLMSLFLDLTDKKYTRCLSKKQRRRINQNDAFHSAVLPGLLR